MIVPYFLITFSEINPCINYTTINNVDRRAVGNVLKLGIIPSLSDDFLDSEWYRINSDAGEQMPTEAPGLFHCGTWYPIWLNGKTNIKTFISYMIVMYTTCSSIIFIPFKEGIHLA